MIITHLLGGLGNQMFQYAAGRALAYQLDTELKMDISSFERYNPRQYNLFPFGIIEHFATSDDISRVQKPLSVRLMSPLTLWKKNLFGAIPIIPVKEKCVDFDPKILELPDNVYLDGYWQSEKYFKDIEGIIRNEFRIKITPDPLNKTIAEQIAQVESVSIHVRRGDYVSNPHTNRVHGVCDQTYFQKAIEKIGTIIDTPHFYVFSDDFRWAKTNITANEPIHFVTHNDASKNYEDLRLMSTCKHHIIANSSFSWWGAWLDPNKNKCIIAPKNWFRNEKFSLEDRFPSEWHLI
jgi:hypothetical protein